MDEKEMKFCAKYPFTQKAKEILKDFQIEQIPEKYREETERRIARALKEEVDPKERRRVLENASEETLNSEIISYPLTKIVTQLTGDPYIKRKTAKEESKKIKHYLQFETKDNVEKIAGEILEIEPKGEEYTTTLNQYLKNKPNGKKHKLVNMPVKKGKVHLNKDDLIEITSSHVYNSFVNQKNIENPPKKLMELAEDIKKYRKSAIKNRGYGRYSSGTGNGKVDYDAFPPCMRKIYEELSAGQDVGHQSRFVLATFMINIGMTMEQMLEPFEGQEKYDEEKTKYYLKHAAGREGRGIRYKCPSCSKMETYNLCVAECNVKHPLSYYYKNRGDGDSDKETSEQNDK